MAVNLSTSNSGSGVISGASLTPSFPTHQVGDMLIVGITGTTPPSTPSGWTEVRKETGSQKVSIYAKIATSTTGENPTFTSMTNGNSYTYYAAVLRSSTSGYELRIPDSLFGATSGQETNTTSSSISLSPSTGWVNDKSRSIAWFSVWNPASWSPSIYSTYGDGITYSLSDGSEYGTGGHGTNNTNKGQIYIDFPGNSNYIGKAIVGVKEVLKDLGGPLLFCQP